MATLQADTTVGELVADRARRAKVFEQYGIDYCCGGGKPLAQACSEKGLDPAEVLAQIATSDAEKQEETEWAQESLTSLADHIEGTHHVFLRSALPRLTQLTEKVARVHGERRPELVRVAHVFDALRTELESHMMKEEQILFPMIRELESSGGLPAFHCGSLRNPISVMEHEHDSAGNALAELRKLTVNYIPPDDACNTYRAMLDALLELEQDLHIHIHKENNILFPRAAKLEAERQALSASL